MQPEPRPVRVLLVDDEPLVRSGLGDALATRPRVEIVGEAGDGLAAIEAIERLRPDLVFLDVQMPGCDGFEVLTQLEEESRPAVVFVTAYEQYALRAFDAHAVDYLLKPFDDARLLAALDRALTWLDRQQPTPQPGMPQLLTDIAAGRRRSRFVCKHGGRLRAVPVDEVEWIEARGNYVHLHHRDGPFLLRETLGAIEATLDPRRFLRVHRSAIVALPEVLELSRRSSGDQEVVMRCGSRVPLGRSHRKAFADAWRG